MAGTAIELHVSEAYHRCHKAWRDALEQAEFNTVYAAWMRCGSPIEQMLVAALRFTTWPAIYGRMTWMQPELAVDIDYPGDALFLKMTTDFVREAVIIYQQQQIGDYRVDFLLVAKFLDRDQLWKVVIECDGHDFHERTREQARHDKKRDRWFTAGGYKVFRFTGSEIYRDAQKRAAEIEAFLWAEEKRTRPD